MGVYTFSSKPTTPGERTPDLLVRFQAVSRTQPCVKYRFMSVHSRTKLHQVRRYITKYFKNVYDGGFIFLCKTKEILRSNESKTTVFDILPKIPHISTQETPRECFQYPDVQYKKVWYNYDGKRYSIVCACVIFLFERSKVSHWPPEILKEELSASAIDGFSHIPTDIVSWSGKLVECRGTPLHIYAALGRKEELSTAIQQLPDGTTAKCLSDQRGATPLHYAAANGKLDVCEIIVAGFGSEMIYHTDKWKRTPLHRALYRRRATTITYLLQMNADIDSQDDNGNNCLDLLYCQKPKDIEFIISKLETDCIDKRVKFCLLYLSMKNRNFSHVRQLVNSIEFCEDHNIIGTTLIHLSVVLKLKDVTKTLINNGFDIQNRDITEFLPFHVACKVGAVDQIQMLMYKEMTDKDINKGLQLCIRYGYIKCCPEITYCRSDIVLEETTVCMIMDTVQRNLRKFKHKAIDEEPLKHFENIASMLLPIIKSSSDVLNTYVFDCALYGASETLILLKSLGATFNVSDMSDRSPLHEAAQSNKLRCTKVLLKGGANINAMDWRGSTPLHYACAAGHNKIIKCLMDNKAIKANVRDVHGRTPLLVAAYYCKHDTVSYLLKNFDSQIDLTVVDRYGFGLIHFVVHLKEDTIDVIAELMSNKHKSLVVDDGHQIKQKVKDMSWIGNIIATDFRSHPSDNAFMRRFCMNRDEMSVLWKNREEGTNEKRKLKKPPKLKFERCAGCNRLLKRNTSVHRCAQSSEKKNKNVTVRPFNFNHDGEEHNQHSPFFLALKARNIHVMRKIRKLDSNASSYRDEFGRNCLYLAIDMKSLKLVKAVIDLVPDVEKSDAIRRVVVQKITDKRDSTPLSLLTYLFSIGCSINGANETNDGYSVLDIAIRSKNVDIVKILVENTPIISDKTMILAVDSGSVEIVQPVMKKWRKNKGKHLSKHDLLCIACSSRNLSFPVVNHILPYYNKDRDHRKTNAGKQEEQSYRDTLCESLEIPVVPRNSLLGKLLYKKHPALKAKNVKDEEVFQKIGTLLLQEDGHLQLETTDAHVVCECLLDCLELKCFDIASKIIKKTSVMVWNCELSDNPCSAQKQFKKKMYNYVAEKLTDLSHLQNLILIASREGVPEKLLYSLLKYGMKYFSSEAGRESSIDLDQIPEERRERVENIDDNMIKLTLTVLELLSGGRKREYNALQLFQFVPGILSHVHLLSRLIDTRPFLKSKEDNFLNRCYQLFQRQTFPPGTTVLHIAAGTHDTDMLKMILKAPVSVDSNAENEDEVSPLDVAVSFGHWKNYKILTENSGVVKSTMLLGCCQKGTYNVRKILKETNPSFDEEKDGKSRLRIFQDVWSKLEVKNNSNLLKEFDQEILHECAKNQLWDIDEFILEKAKQTVVNQYNQDSEYLRLLCINGPTTLMTKHLDNVEKCLKSLSQKAIEELILNVTIRNEDAISTHMITKTLQSYPFHWEMLCEDKHGKTALHHAAMTGNLVVLKYIAYHIVHSRWSPWSVLDNSGESPLWYALTNKQWKSAQCLLISGCEPKFRKAIPEIDTKRHFKGNTSKDKILTFNESCITDKREGRFGIRVFPFKINKSTNMAYRLGKKKGNIFELKQKRTTPKEREEQKKKKINSHKEIVPMKRKRNDECKKTLDMLRLARIATHNNACLIHIAFALGKKELINEIMAFDETCVQSKDKNGLSPFIYSIVNDNIYTKHDEDVDLDLLQALVWRFTASETIKDRILYSITQLLSYYCVRHSTRLDEAPFSSESSVGRHLNAIYNKNCHEAEDTTNASSFHYAFGEFNSKTLLKSLIYNTKNMLSKFYEDPVVEEFVKIFSYIGFGDDAKKYNTCQYKFLAFSTKECKEKQHAALVDNIKKQLAIGVGKIPKEILALLILSGEAWVIKLLVELVQEKKDDILSQPCLLDLTVTDLIPFSVQSEKQLSRYTFDTDILSHLNALIKMEPSVTLRSDIVDIAKEKQLWQYLEIIGKHTLVETGVLNPVWQNVLAKAAACGQIKFVKAIVNYLEVPKMTEEQKSCFTAFICIAALNGKLDIVTFLANNRIPLLGEMDESPIKDLIGKCHVTNWNILDYAVKGNSKETVDYVLKFLKDDKNIRSMLNRKRLLQLSTKNGNVEIFKSICHFMDNSMGLRVTREEFNDAYVFSLTKGREMFCLHLLEHNNTTLVVHTDDKSNSLHYAAMYGMTTLAEKIVKTRPEVIDQSNTKGYTPLEYAASFGKHAVAKVLVEFKANVPYTKTNKYEWQGWFHTHMLENENIQVPEKEDKLQPFKKKRTNDRCLTVLTALENGNDGLGACAINCNKYLVKANLKSRDFSDMELFFASSRTGCVQSLKILLEITKDDENLQSTIMSYEKNNLTLMATAIKNCQVDCINLLFESVIENKWKKSNTGENILHLAVKTENVHIVKIVDEKTNNELRNEVDNKNLSPILYAANFGLHQITAYLTYGTELREFSADHHLHDNDDDDIHLDTCLECVLDLCIGWSKFYQRKEEISERQTRSIMISKRRGVFKKSRRVAFNLGAGWRLRESVSKEKNEHLLKIISQGTHFDCNVWKSILMSMGYKDEIVVLHEFEIRYSSDLSKTLHSKIRDTMGRKNYTDTLIRLSENVTDRDDLILTAAAVGNTQFIQHFRNSDINDSDNANVIEIAFAFGNTNTATVLQVDRENLDLRNAYPVFSEIVETLPQKIKWLTGLEKPGDEEWTNSIKTAPLENQLSRADLWLFAKFSEDKIERICKNVDLNEMVPQQVNGKKFTADLESFKKNALLTNLNSITLRAFLSSSLLYGRQIKFFSENENGNEKVQSVQSVKIVCEPYAPGNMPRVHIDPSGNYIESFALAKSVTGTALMVDNSLHQRREEATTKNRVLELVLPNISHRVEEAFGRKVNLKIDWSSLEVRRRTGNYDTILHSLVGTSSGSALAGLEDVIEQCIEICRDLRDMYDQRTVDLALQSLSHIKEITVVYVDNLQRPGTPRKGKTTSLSDIITWEFTYDRNTLKYNRDTFALLASLQRYHHLAGAVYNAVYRISDLETGIDFENNTGIPNIYYKPKTPLTLDVDLKSFGMKIGTMLNGKLCQGVSREVDAIARECEAMMRLKIDANYVVLKNSASVQGTGITLQDSTVTVSVCTYLNSQKSFTVERGQIRSKLEEIEDQQLFRSWKSELFQEVEKEMKEVSEKLKRNYGLNVKLTFDEKRMTSFAIQKYRRDMPHPQNLLIKMMLKCLQNICHGMEDLIIDVFNNSDNDYCINVPHTTRKAGLYLRCQTPFKIDDQTAKNYMFEKVVNFFDDMEKRKFCLDEIDTLFTSSETVPPSKDTENLHWVSYWKHFGLESLKQKEVYKGLISIKKPRYIYNDSSAFGLYKITNVPAFQRVISGLPEKININLEILQTVEGLEASKLKNKLYPDLNQIIRTARLPTNTTLLINQIKLGVSKIFLVLKLDPPEINIDLQSFFQKSELGPDDTQRRILDISTCFKHALLDLIADYHVLKPELHDCPLSNMLRQRLLGILKKIDLVIIKQRNDQPITNKKNNKKGQMLSLSFANRTVEVTINEAPIDESQLQRQFYNLPLAVIIGDIKNDLLRIIANELNIKNSHVSISAKVQDNMDVELALLWYEHLYKYKEELSLSNFHNIKVEGTSATFQMTEKTARLDITVAVDEKLQIDTKLFKKVCKPLKVETEITLNESDLQFLCYGENSVRIRCHMNIRDFLAPSLYIIKMVNEKTNLNESIYLEKCDADYENGFIALHFSVPEKVDADSKISIFHDSKQIGQSQQVLLKKVQFSKDVIPNKSCLHVARNGWVYIGVKHDCSHVDFENKTKVLPFTQVHNNKIIQPFIASTGVAFVACFTQSHTVPYEHLWQRCIYHEVLRAMPVTVKCISRNNEEKYIIHVNDGQTEVRIKAYCRHCKQPLKISTPFKDIAPSNEFIINGLEEDAEQNNV